MSSYIEKDWRRAEVMRVTRWVTRVLTKEEVDNFDFELGWEGDEGGHGVVCHRSRSRFLCFDPNLCASHADAQE